MNILPVNDLLEWSIFKCKVCSKRLQRSIICVGGYGNVCEACYERSCFINTTQNIELEELLSKLHVPCNYKERGCSYDGNYYNTCEHEKRCWFRDKICPFAYLDMCENHLRDIYDMAGHISHYHRGNVLTVENNCSVIIQNPTETKANIFYLFRFENNDLLLRTWIDTKEQCIYYAFYYFKDEDALKNSKFSFNMGCENTMFTVTSTNVGIQHESTIRSKCDTENAVKIPLAVLKCLNCLESVKVLINVDGDSMKPSINVEDLEEQSAWIVCSQVQNKMEYCTSCSNMKCMFILSTMLKSKCTAGTCNFVPLDLSKGQIFLKFLCDNPGCNQLVRGSKYKKHKDYCLFKKIYCPAHSELQCSWEGLLKEMAAHIKLEHAMSINKNTYYSGKPDMFFFFKGNDIFKQSYELSSDGILTIRTTSLTSSWDNTYIWEIRIKRKDRIIMVITETNFFKTIDVGSYVENDGLTFYVDIKHASK